MDLFEQLGEMPVPPPPAKLDRLVHERLNKRLVALQLLDVMLRTMPLAMLEFARSVTGLIAYTVTGRYGSRRGDQTDQ